MTMQQPRTVAGLLGQARQQLVESDYQAKAWCVDVLLDCLNASVRPAVRDVVADRLSEFSVGNIARTESFISALDEIQMALQVDAAFDDLELHAG